MNTKIAFFDIDGTLVNVPNGMLHPTDETIRVLNEFKNQGNKIVIATARGEEVIYLCTAGKYTSPYYNEGNAWLWPYVPVLL